MDWDGVIEKNREALKRIVASLLAMAGLGAPSSPPHPELVEGVGWERMVRLDEAKSRR